jgi:hypothetical protein
MTSGAKKKNLQDAGDDGCVSRVMRCAACRRMDGWTTPLSCCILSHLAQGTLVKKTHWQDVLFVQSEALEEFVHVCGGL